MINFRLLRHLWYFTVVSEEQSFRRAADRLGISQPPLTQQIKALEAALGLTLLERSSRQTRLTPQGAAILPEAIRLIEQAERMNRIVTDIRRGRFERLIIAAISTVIMHVLPKVIEILRELYPDAAISVVEMDSVAGLQAVTDGEADLAFGRFYQVRPPLKMETLFTDRLSLVAAKGHPLLDKPEVTMPDLADCDWVHFARRHNPPGFDRIISACSAHGFLPRFTYQVHGQASQMAFVACGFGIALVPRKMSELYLDHVDVRPLEPRLEVTTAAAAWVRRTPLVETTIALAREHGTRCGVPVVA